MDDPAGHRAAFDPGFILAGLKEMQGAAALPDSDARQGMKWPDGVSPIGSTIQLHQAADVKVDAAQVLAATGQVGEIAATRVPGIAYIPGIATFEGGLPIMTADGKHIGSIGVSGASAEQDGICAQAGIDAVKNDLK